MSISQISGFPENGRSEHRQTPAHAGGSTVESGPVSEGAVTIARYRAEGAYKAVRNRKGRSIADAYSTYVTKFTDYADDALINSHGDGVRHNLNRNDFDQRQAKAQRKVQILTGKLEMLARLHNGDDRLDERSLREMKGLLSLPPSRRCADPADVQKTKAYTARFYNPEAPLPLSLNRTAVPERDTMSRGYAFAASPEPPVSRNLRKPGTEMNSVDAGAPSSSGRAERSAVAEAQLSDLYDTIPFVELPPDAHGTVRNFETAVALLPERLRSYHRERFRDAIRLNINDEVRAVMQGRSRRPAPVNPVPPSSSLLGPDEALRHHEACLQNRRANATNGIRAVFALLRGGSSQSDVARLLERFDLYLGRIHPGEYRSAVDALASEIEQMERPEPRAYARAEFAARYAAPAPTGARPPDIAASGRRFRAFLNNLTRRR